MSRLLDIALQLTRESGRAPTLAELAHASGVSRATVYRAFANQQGLVEQLGAQGEPVPEEGSEVFDAVRAVLLTEGLDGFTLEAVASRSGVSRATLHRRYEGRDGLLVAFFDQLPPRTSAWRLPDDGAADEVLAGFALRLSSWLVADASLLIAALSCSARTRERLRALRSTGVGTHEALADWLRARGEGAGRPVHEPLAAARAFLGAVVGLSASGPLTPEQARWWARVFLSGLGLV